ncbi:MAG: LacI family DNA-binding transcriptional regulator [Eubacteriales bacterium]|nr:LacI family DNA-binding transcriptional regulator [Eubacteriales bacterium]
MPNKVTINMVAKRAGVSRGTVDRVLNQRPHVKPELYDKIVRAMKELGYIPPRREQAEALGLAMPDMSPATLGIVLPNWTGYFREEILRGIRDAQPLLADSAITVLIEECRTELPQETLERIDHLVKKGVCGIALCAMDDIAIAEKINALYKQNIPVVTFNSDISHCKRLQFIGQDLVRSGRVAGELMAKYIRQDDILLIAIGNPEFHAHRLRVQGFCERLHEKGFFGRNIQTIETYNDYRLTYQKVKEALERVPEIRGIYMANQSVTGCVEAMREAGKSGQILVISHDLTDSTKQFLKNGAIDFAIAQNIYQQGYGSLLLLRDYVRKNLTPEKTAQMPAIDIICSENLGED